MMIEYGPKKSLGGNQHSTAVSADEKALLELSFNSQQRMAFWLLAKGKTRPYVADCLGLPQSTFDERVLSPVYRRLGTDNLTSSVSKLLDAGIFDPKELTRGFDFGLIDRLTFKQKEVLKVLAGTAEQDPSSKALSELLNSSPKTIRNHISIVNGLLGTTDRVELVVLQRAYQSLEAEGYVPERKDLGLNLQEIKIYELKARGFDYLKIGQILHYPVQRIRNITNDARKKTGSANNLDLILNLVNQGIIDACKIAENVNLENFGKLPDYYFKVLNALIDPANEPSVRKSIAGRIGYSEGNVKNILYDIYNYFDINSYLNLAVLYKAYTMGAHRRSDSAVA